MCECVCCSEDERQQGYFKAIIFLRLCAWGQLLPKEEDFLILKLLIVNIVQICLGI